MNKKINHPYLFLFIAIFMMIKAISSLTRFFGFHLGNTFSDYVTRHSIAYKAGYFFGGIISVILFAGLSIYFFNKFKKVSQSQTV